MTNEGRSPLAINLSRVIQENRSRRDLLPLLAAFAPGSEMSARINLCKVASTRVSMPKVLEFGQLNCQQRLLYGP
jgi:hypothetical protein